MFKRISVFVYGVVSYAVFFGTFLYAIGFIGDLGVPKSIDSVPEAPLWAALAVNALLLGAFAVQHSVMARPAFKRWITRYIPKPAERSTYTLVASLLLIALFAFWEPIGGVIWRVDDPVGQAVLYGLFAFGWALVLVATFLINHFDLFGLPLYVGWFFAFWATPTMTSAHLVFALLATGYILIAIQLEERDLVRFHPEYAGYRRRVPMLIPRFGRRRSGGTPAAESA
ncbi:MAG: isoprenylcysteine carboxylmethyltransferase family protein [Chromatiaceae bacterium]